MRIYTHIFIKIHFLKAINNTCFTTRDQQVLEGFFLEEISFSISFNILEGLYWRWSAQSTDLDSIENLLEHYRFED